MVVKLNNYYSLSGNILSQSTSSPKPFEKQSALKTLEQLEQAKDLLRTFGDDKTTVKTHAVATEIFENYESKWCFICRLWDWIKRVFVTTERGKIHEVYQKILKQTDAEIPLVQAPTPTTSEPIPKPTPVESEPKPEPEISIHQVTLSEEVMGALTEKLKLYTKMGCVDEIVGDFSCFEIRPEDQDAAILLVSNKLLEEGYTAHIPHVRVKIKSETKFFEFKDKVVDYYCSKGLYKEAYDNAWYIAEKNKYLGQIAYKKICEHSWKNKKFDKTVQCLEKMARLEMNYPKDSALKLRGALIATFEADAFKEKDAGGVEMVSDLYLQAKELKKVHTLVDRVCDELRNEELFHKIHRKLAMAEAQFIPIKF